MTGKVKRIIITGPESTGKSTLAKQLADYYNTVFLPEYARTYIENLNRPYNYDDIVNIAKMQIRIEKSIFKKANKFLFIDTGLIITKIWFIEAYNKYPAWLNKAIAKSLPELYLMCNFDLPWKNDPVRENGSNERRRYLMNRYIREIESCGIKYYMISGQGKMRLKNAINYIDSINPDKLVRQE